MFAAPACPQPAARERTRPLDGLPPFPADGPPMPTHGRVRFRAVPATRLKRYARRALGTIAPVSAIAERTFVIGESRVVMLAAALPHGRRIPRSPDLIRLAIASGAGLRFRTIGRLSVIVLESPPAAECTP